MFVKIAGIVLSGVIVVGGIFGISQLDRSYKGYDAYFIYFKDNGE